MHFLCQLPVIDLINFAKSRERGTLTHSEEPQQIAHTAKANRNHALENEEEGKSQKGRGDFAKFFKAPQGSPVVFSVRMHKVGPTGWRLLEARRKEYSR